MMTSEYRPTTKHGIPLRFVLSVPFVLLVIISTGLIGYLSYWNSQRAVHEVTENLRVEIMLRVVEYLEDFMETPHLINRLNADTLSEGWLEVDDQDTIARYFWQQVQKFEKVTSIYFGNSAGGLVNSGREGDQDLLYIITTEDFAAGLFEKYAVDREGRRKDLLAAVPDFDARTRPWFTRATEKGDAVWSDAYILFTGHDMAISASRPVYDAEKDLAGVVAVDIFLSHLSDFLAGLRIGKTGQCFIMERSGLLIATSTGNQVFTTDEEAETPARIPAEECASPLTAAAAAALIGELGDYQNITASQELTFQYDGEPHSLLLQPLSDEYGLDWLIVLVIPEADFMARINANNRLTISLIILAMLTAVFIGILAARWIATPVSLLRDTAGAVSEGMWQQKKTTVWIREISELMASFHHMNQKTQEMIENLTDEIFTRTKLEKELATLNRQLSSANADLKKFAEVSAHHLQEPARRLGIYTKLLGTSLVGLCKEEKGEVKEDIELALRYMAEGSGRLQKLLRDIQLYLAAGEPLGKVTLLDTTDIVKEVINDLEGKINHASADIEIGQLPSLQMDRRRLHDIFTILISNALDYNNPAVPPRIYISGEKKENILRFQVSDNGIGIPDEYHERVFGVFERLQARAADTAATEKNTGIGLAIVQRIIESCQGQVWIENSTLGGTTVFFELPYQYPIQLHHKY